MNTDFDFKTIKKRVLSPLWTKYIRDHWPTTITQNWVNVGVWWEGTCFFVGAMDYESPVSVIPVVCFQYGDRAKEVTYFFRENDPVEILSNNEYYKLVADIVEILTFVPEGQVV